MFGLFHALLKNDVEGKKIDIALRVRVVLKPMAVLSAFPVWCSLIIRGLISPDSTERKPHESQAITDKPEEMGEVEKS